MDEENPLSIDSVDAGKETHFSNIFGSLIWSWSPRNFNQLIDYDRLQRRVKVEVKKINEDGTVASDNVVELYTYGETQLNPEDNNLRGQVFQLNDLSGIITNSQYGMKGEIQQTSSQLTADYKGTVNWDDDVTLEPDQYMTQFHYDALSRLISQTTPDGTITTNTYNQSGLLDTVTLQYKDGTTQPIVNHIEYDTNRQRSQITYENGVITKYTYEDTTLRLIKLYSTRPTKDSREPVIQNIEYTYDPVGNITRTRDYTFETVFCNNQQVEPLSDYTYDALYRLIKANGRQHPGINSDTYVNNKKDGDFKQSKFGYLCPPNPNDQTHLENYSETYTYDDAGNLVKKQHTASSSSWSMDTPVEENSNRLKDREYDASGNLRQLQLNSAVTLYFNCCENLVKTGIIERPDELDDADYYNYDSNELRTRKVSERMEYGGTVTEKEEKIYLGNYEIKRIKSETAEGETTILYRQTLRVMDDKTCVAIMYYWVQDDLQREVEKSGTRKLRYQLDNNLGSVSLEVDDDAALISYEEYFPYGGTAIIAGDNQKEVELKEYRYSGKERDDSTGLYYYGARYYAPWLGRWLNPDPAGTIDGLNLYAFVGGNPVIYMDVRGMMFVNKNLKRPNFQQSVYTTATMTHDLFQRSYIDPHNPNLQLRNAAVPHRMSWADIRDNTLKYLNKQEGDNDFLRWTDRFVQAAKSDINRIRLYVNNLTNPTKNDINYKNTLETHIKKGINTFERQRRFLMYVVQEFYSNNPNKPTKDYVINVAGDFLTVFNSFYPNVPDLGPHRGTNIQVSNRIHLNVEQAGNLSPMSNQVLDMTPARTSGVATTPRGTNIVTTSGNFVPISNLSNQDRQRINKQRTVPVKAHSPRWKPY
jgi:RHS repeat-associated protein